MQNQNISFFSEEMEKQITETVISLVTETINETLQKPQKKFFRKKEFCEEVGCSFNTLQKWIHELGLPVVSLSGTQFISWDDFVIFTKKHTI